MTKARELFFAVKEHHPKTEPGMLTASVSALSANLRVDAVFLRGALDENFIEEVRSVAQADQRAVHDE